LRFVSANAWLAYSRYSLPLCWRPFRSWVSVIPGSTIILALSALVPGGDLRIEWVLAAAIAGALLGDGIGLTGSVTAPSAKSSLPWPLSNYPRVIAQSEAFFSPLGRSGGILRALRATDPRLRADHGGRARHAAGCVFFPSTSRRSCCGRWRMCCLACSRCRWLHEYAGLPTMPGSPGITGYWRWSAARFSVALGHLDNPPPPWRWIDSSRPPPLSGIPQGFSVRFRPARLPRGP